MYVEDQGGSAEALELTVMGHPVTVTREARGFNVRTMISFPPQIINHLATLELELAKAQVVAYGRIYVVVDEDGKELTRSYYAGHIRPTYLRHQALSLRQQSHENLLAQFKELKAAAALLEQTGLPTRKLMLATSQCKLHTMRLARTGSTDYSQLVSALKHLENLITELKGPFVDVVVRHLLDGSLPHPDHRHNNRVQAKLVQLWIRAGGQLIELIDEERLAGIYRDRLRDCTTVAEVSRTDLRLELDDYAPGWLLEDPELNLAPEQMEIPFSDKIRQLPVAYSLQAEGDDQIPTGTIRLSLQRYRQVQAVYGRRSTIPALPHNIRLIIEVTINDQVIAKGTDGEALQRRIKRYQSGQRRSGIVPLGMRAEVLADGPPPWHVGRVRWR